MTPLAAKYGRTIESQKQREIYDFIEQYQREHGVTPHLGLIGDAIGRSLKTASYHVGVMIEKKILARDETSKGIKLNPEYATGVWVKVSEQ